MQIASRNCSKKFYSIIYPPTPPGKTKKKKNESRTMWSIRQTHRGETVLRSFATQCSALTTLYVQSLLPVVKARSAVKKADPMGSVLNTVDHTQVSSNRSQTEDRSKWKMDKSPFMAYLEAIEAVLSFRCRCVALLLFSIILCIHCLQTCKLGFEHALVNVSLPLSPKQNDVIQKDFSKLKSIVALFLDSVFFMHWCRF